MEEVLSDQGSKETNQASGEAPKAIEVSTDTVAPANAEVETLKHQIAALDAKRDQLERDNAKYREERRQQKEADEAAKLKAGEYEPLLKERDAALAEMQTKVVEYEADAKAYREWVKAEEAAIASLAETLSEQGQRIVAALPLSERRTAIAELSGVQPKERPPEHPAGNPSPPSLDPDSFKPGVSRDDPGTWQRIKDELGLKNSRTANKPFWD